MIKNYFYRDRQETKGSFMKFILNILFITITLLAIQACGTVPLQTTSHIGDSSDRFGSGTYDSPFDQQSDKTSPIGFNQPEPQPVAEDRFDQQNKMDIGIIFMPATFQNGFTITDRMLRFCETLYKSPCTHLRVQAGQPYGFPRAPVSLPEE